MLKIQKRNVIDVLDWDNLVEKTYGKIYNFQQQDGCQSRGTYTLNIGCEVEDDYPDTVPLKINGEEMGVNLKSWLETDSQKHKNKMNWEDWQVSMFWERNFYPNIEVLAYDLHKKGLIEKGEYDIKIDW